MTRLFLILAIAFGLTVSAQVAAEEIHPIPGCYPCDSTAR
jgi:hypothetical protein